MIQAPRLIMLKLFQGDITVYSPHLTLFFLPLFSFFIVILKLPTFCPVLCVSVPLCSLFLSKNTIITMHGCLFKEGGKEKKMGAKS